MPWALFLFFFGTKLQFCFETLEFLNKVTDTKNLNQSVKRGFCEELVQPAIYGQKERMETYERVCGGVTKYVRKLPCEIGSSRVSKNVNIALQFDIQQIAFIFSLYTVQFMQLHQGEIAPYYLLMQRNQS
eukprot:TRINITY_DN10826_c1_g1_i10.p5 TRINITY_DN10826_c1_g1~~TRINITY_DN10826_c1_g1_i10.p5  ORF type:complete len:130 (-),score=2.95 TRINITY_DN10826_c1_g1_i10:677-1066(-)